MIYLDNMATTKPFDPHITVVPDFVRNPNAAYSVRESETLYDCRERVKRSLGVSSGKVIFCSSASHAMSILNKHLDIDCPDYEHASVYWCKHSACDDYADAYVHQYVNPISGDIFDIKKIFNKARKKYRFTISDFTAAIGRVVLPDRLEDFCDAVFFSGHKFYAPLGAGCLWISDSLAKYMDATDNPVDEYGLCYGTPNLPGIIKMVDCLETFNNYDRILNYEERYRGFCDLLFNLKFPVVDERNDPVVDKLLDDTGSVSLMYNPKIEDGRALASYLATKEIYVGLAHSACEANSNYRVTTALGFTEEQARASIRVSYSIYNTEYDIMALDREVGNFIKEYC